MLQMFNIHTGQSGWQTFGLQDGWCGQQAAARTAQPAVGGQQGWTAEPAAGRLVGWVGGVGGWTVGVGAIKLGACILKENIYFTVKVVL